MSILSNNLNLVNLTLRRTEIQTVDALAKLKKIWHLDIEGTRVTDFSPLSKLPKLADLRVGEYLSKNEYGPLDTILVSDLGLNWRSISGKEDIQRFIQQLSKT